jgi:hypothetical protein
MRVRPIRDDAVGVTISETEYSMPPFELRRLHGMIGEAIAAAFLGCLSSSTPYKVSDVCRDVHGEPMHGIDNGSTLR